MALWNALAAMGLTSAPLAAPAAAKSEKAGQERAVSPGQQKASQLQASQLQASQQQNKDAASAAQADPDAGENDEDAILDAVLDGVFGEDEREIIQDYARTRGIGTTRLPPGVAKNVARGKPLPPGVAERGLPDELEARLPELRDGLERVIAGDDVAIIEEGARIIVDILKEVLRDR